MSDLMVTGGSSDLIFTPEETQVKKIVELQNSQDTLRKQKNRYGLMSLIFGAMLLTALAALPFVRSITQDQVNQLKLDNEKEVSKFELQLAEKETVLNEKIADIDLMRKRADYLEQYHDIQNLRIEIDTKKQDLAELKETVLGQVSAQISGKTVDDDNNELPRAELIKVYQEALPTLKVAETIMYQPAPWTIAGGSNLRAGNWDDTVERGFEQDLEGYSAAISKTKAWLVEENIPPPPPKKVCNPFKPSDTNCS